MTTGLQSSDLRPAWKALEAHRQKVRELLGSMLTSS